MYIHSLKTNEMNNSKQANHDLNLAKNYYGNIGQKIIQFLKENQSNFSAKMMAKQMKCHPSDLSQALKDLRQTNKVKFKAGKCEISKRTVTVYCC